MNKEPEFKPYFRTCDNVAKVVAVIKQPKIQYTPDGQKIILENGITVRLGIEPYRPNSDEEEALLLELSKKKPYIIYVSEKEQRKEYEKRIAMEKAAKEIEEKYK